LVGTSAYLRYPIIGDTLRANGLIRNAVFLADLLIGALFALYLLSHRVFIAPYQKILTVFLLFTCLILTKEKAGLLFILGILWLVPVFYRISGAQWLRGLVFLGIVFFVFTVHFLWYKDLSHHPFGQFEVVFPISFHSSVWWIASTPYIDLKKAALIAFLEHPFFGAGGNCLMAFTDTLIERGAIIQPLCCAPHSTFFGALGELGLMGFGALIFLIGTVFKRVCAILTPPERALALVFIAYFCVSGINLDMMNIRHYWIWLVFLTRYQ